MIGSTLAATPFVWKGLTIPMSFSYGVHELESEIDAESAMARADDAMYAQKRHHAQAATTLAEKM